MVEQASLSNASAEIIAYRRSPYRVLLTQAVTALRTRGLNARPPGWRWKPARRPAPTKNPCAPPDNLRKSPLSV
ncbi:hypothetical protein HA052_17575 [Chromobacterium haemolyticum]|uniref:Uncharacterized protein n=1 Tax=Chromobacterium fluminis TaxID=3044269 RepID=A0ABX0LBT5_9NEIS|nr:hypothetical protein [Chromobacterium haemolyticum]NHR07002.1 hypothetical protein [Chromobacterium haemolyticum]